jgi:glycosyltransferase involved in cell wall biosynthesis
MNNLTYCNMNILIINHYAGSPNLGREFRPYFLAKEWVKLNHQVTIIGAEFSHLRYLQPNVTRDFQIDKLDNINYIWLRTPRYRTSGLRRILNMLFFVTKLLIFKKKIISTVNPDVVIASSTYPLDIYPAYLIAKRNNAKLVYELHDLWPLSPLTIGGYSKHHPFIWVIQKAENFACKKSDACISMLKNARSYLIEHGLKEDNFYYVPNGFSPDELESSNIPLPKEHELLLDKLQASKKIIVGYVGGHSPSNALKTFLSATYHFAININLCFLLIGDGMQKEELLSFIAKRRQKNVFFLPQVSKTQVPNLLSKMDILYAGGVKTILHTYGTSFNKITDYMLAGKPIIFSVDDPQSIIEKTGCGIRIPAENESELINAINYMIKLSAEERNSIGEKGRIFALKELNYTHLAKLFLNCL